MNKVELLGRLTTDPELKSTEGGKNYTRFTLAVNRKFKNSEGELEADFISVVAWNKQAEIITSYVKKGNRLIIIGRIQTGSYEKNDGTKGYITDVIVEDFNFIEGKPKDGRPEPEYTENDSEDTDPFQEFGDTLELTDDDLPF